MSMETTPLKCKGFVLFNHLSLSVGFIENICVGWHVLLIFRHYVSDRKFQCEKVGNGPYLTIRLRTTKTWAFVIILCLFLDSILRVFKKQIQSKEKGMIGSEEKKKGTHP